MPLGNQPQPGQMPPEEGGAPAPGGMENLTVMELVRLAVNSTAQAAVKVEEEFAGTSLVTTLPALLEEVAGALGQALEEMEQMAEPGAEPGAPPAPAPPTVPEQ